MPVTADQANLLATLAVACRPHGARRWDPPGVVAAVRKVAHLALPDVTHALVRAAEDRGARTPAVIVNLQSSYWRERDPDRMRPRVAFDPALWCGSCGRELAGGCCDKPQRSDQAAATAVDSREGHAERLKRLRDEAAAKLCRHHVPPNNCKDCTTPTTTEETSDEHAPTDPA